MYSFLSATTLDTSRCARLNTRKPNDATIQTPPDYQLKSRYTPLRLLTYYTHQSYQKLIKTGRSFPYRQSHALEVEFEKDPWDPLAVLE
jgi:hypothetical protein